MHYSNSNSHAYKAFVFGGKSIKFHCMHQINKFLTNEYIMFTHITNLKNSQSQMKFSNFKECTYINLKVAFCVIKEKNTASQQSADWADITLQFRLTNII
jgi:hypothetical protein